MRKSFTKKRRTIPVLELVQMLPTDVKFKFSDIWKDESEMLRQSFLTRMKKLPHVEISKCGVGNVYFISTEGKAETIEELLTGNAKRRVKEAARLKLERENELFRIAMFA